MPVKSVLYSRLGLGNMQGKSSVCRCLFGKPNHEDLRRDLDAQLKSTSTQFKSTWNFDPDLDNPMAGRLDWVKVQEDEYVPEFYRKGYLSRKPKSRRRELSLDAQPEIDLKSSHTPSRVPVESLGHVFTPIEDDVDDIRKQNETTPESRIVPLRQTTMGEFMRVRKPKRRLSGEFSSDDDDDRPTKSQRTSN